MKKILMATAAAALMAGSAQAASIVNGSFEIASDGYSNPVSGGFTTLNAVSNAIQGWTVSNGSVDWINGYWAAADGTHSIDLSGNGNGWIEQTFATNAGTLYTVTYYLSGNPDAGSVGKNAVIEALINNSTIQLSDITGIKGDSHDQMNWELKRFQFTAQGSQTTLRFQSLTNNPYGAAIDNVSISPVPEPATWAMMIGGFGLVGGAMRRRSRMQTAIA